MKRKNLKMKEIKNKGGEDILVFTKQGQVIRFDARSVPRQFRRGVGIKSITLREGDEVVSVLSVKSVK